MPVHKITVHPSKPLDIASADLVVEIESGGKKLGELWISRGTIDWKPRAKKQASTSLTWEQFDRLMRDAE